MRMRFFAFDGRVSFFDWCNLYQYIGVLLKIWVVFWSGVHFQDLATFRRSRSHFFIFLVLFWAPLSKNSRSETLFKDQVRTFRSIFDFSDQCNFLVFANLTF